MQNSASHGHNSRAVVDRGVREHDTMSASTTSTGMEPETSKIVECDQGTTLLVGSGCFCLMLARHAKL